MMQVTIEITLKYIIVHACLYRFCSTL